MRRCSGAGASREDCSWWPPVPGQAGSRAARRQQQRRRAPWVHTARPAQRSLSEQDGRCSLRVIAKRAEPGWRRPDSVFAGSSSRTSINHHPPFINLYNSRLVTSTTCMRQQRIYSRRGDQRSRPARAAPTAGISGSRHGQQHRDRQTALETEYQQRRGQLRTQGRRYSGVNLAVAGSAWSQQPEGKGHST